MTKSQLTDWLPNLLSGVVLVGLGIAAALVLYPMFAGAAVERGADARAEWLSDAALTDEDSADPILTDAQIEQVRSFCGDCHATPEPSLFPRDGWHAEVVRGYRFYAESGRHDLDPPPPSLAVRYYVDAASEQLEMPDPLSRLSSGDQPWFDSKPIQFRSPLNMQPGIGSLKLGFSNGQLLAADMVSGHIWLGELQQGQPTIRSIARLNYPCRIEWGDIDGDGAEDLLVADLGVYYADDRKDGSIVWLRRVADGQLAPPQPILEGIGRACDMRVGDFNGDGLPDVVAAEFGWLKTGGLHLLIQSKATQATSSNKPVLSFTHKVLDDRAGAVHLLPVDLDQDERLDLLALFGQQYESIDWYRTPGAVELDEAIEADSLLTERKRLYQAPDPGYGSSGFEQVDFDGDGDLDLLYSHGDTFDGPYVKPSHGVHWLENRGNLEYQPHRLTHMAGAYSATTADWDEDGDLDVAISAWLPSETRQFDREKAVSVLLMERVGNDEFRSHVLERGNPVRASLIWADVDQDGDLDLAASRDTENPDDPVLIDCWLNRLR